MMGGGGGGGGSNVMSPSRCSCIYTSPEASCVSKIPTQKYCVYWVNRSHVSECSLYKLYSGPVFPNL